MSDDLMVVEQLPIIREQLETVKAAAQRKVEYALSLECTEATYKEIKKLRSELNAQFKDLETRRIGVKKAVLAPYERFEGIYKECVTNILKPADAALAERINTVENSIKQEKADEAKAFFAEYAQSKKIDFVSFEQVGLNITMAASRKSLHAEIQEFLDRCADDIEMINTQPHSAEILVEYKNSLNASNAILTVTNRMIAVEEEKARAEAVKAAEQAEDAADEETDNGQACFFAPTVVNSENSVVDETDEEKETISKRYTVAFKYTTTDLDSIRDIKKIMERCGEYEQL